MAMYSMFVCSDAPKIDAHLSPVTFTHAGSVNNAPMIALAQSRISPFQLDTMQTNHKFAKLSLFYNNWHAFMVTHSVKIKVFVKNKVQTVNDSQWMSCIEVLKLYSRDVREYGK